MLIEPTQTKLLAMKLNGMAEAYQEQRTQPRISDLDFDERFALLVERQWLWKQNRALATRLAFARLRQSACIEAIDYTDTRGLKRALINQLASCDWVNAYQNLIVTGPTGCGKTFVACALAHKACREGHRVLYYYGPKLFRELAAARADGSMAALLKKIAKTRVLVIDDWGLTKIDDRQHREFLEILDDRHGQASTVITSQWPVESWHETIGDPTVADAILDRLIHNAHRIELKGDSMRKRQARSHMKGGDDSSR